MWPDQFQSAGSHPGRARDFSAIGQHDGDLRTRHGSLDAPPRASKISPSGFPGRPASFEKIVPALSGPPDDARCALVSAEVDLRISLRQ